MKKPPDPLVVVLRPPPPASDLFWSSPASLRLLNFRLDLEWLLQDVEFLGPLCVLVTLLDSLMADLRVLQEQGFLVAAPVHPRSKLDDRIVPDLCNDQLCSFLSLVVIRSQDIQISFLTLSSLFPPSFLYSNLIIFNLDCPANEDCILSIFCMGKRIRKEMDYDNDLGLLFTDRNMGFHYHFHEINYLCGGLAEIDICTLFSYKKACCRLTVLVAHFHWARDDALVGRSWMSYCLHLWRSFAILRISCGIMTSAFSENRCLVSEGICFCLFVWSYDTQWNEFQFRQQGLFYSLFVYGSVSLFCILLAGYLQFHPLYEINDDMPILVLSESLAVSFMSCLWIVFLSYFLVHRISLRQLLNCATGCVVGSRFAPVMVEQTWPITLVFKGLLSETNLGYLGYLGYAVFFFWSICLVSWCFRIRQMVISFWQQCRMANGLGLCDGWSCPTDARMFLLAWSCNFVITMNDSSQFQSVQDVIECSLNMQHQCNI